MAKSDMEQDKATVRSGVHKHERALHKGQPMTKLKKGGEVPKGLKKASHKDRIEYNRDMPVARKVKGMDAASEAKRPGDKKTRGCGKAKHGCMHNGKLM